MAKPIRLSRIEIWTDLQCAGGARLAVARDVLSAEDSREEGGVERLRFQIDRGSDAWSHVAEQRVARVVFSDGTWEEWRIVDLDDARDETGALRGTVEATTPLLDLADADQVVTRVEANGVTTHDFGLYGLTPSEAIAEILSWAPAYFAAGVIAPTAPVDLTFSWDSPLSALRQLAELADAEFELERNGTTGYRIHLRSRTADLTPTARIRYRRNQRGIRRRRSVDPLMTRAYPRGGAVEGFHADMGEAAWRVIAAAGAAITLEDGVVAFADQLNGLWAENAATGARAQIVGSGTDQVLQLSGAIAGVGDLVHVRASAAGARLTHLDNLAAATKYLRPGRHKSKVVDLPDVPAVDNLVANPYAAAWTGSTPDHFAAVGAAALAKQTSQLYRQHGTASIDVTAAAEGEGVETAWIPLAPTAERPYFSAQIALWVASGAVRLELVAETEEGTQLAFPEGGAVANTTVVGAWVENLAIAGEDLRKVNAVRAKLRVVAHKGAARFYLDAAQLTQTAGGAEAFYDGRASNQLWKEANRSLIEHAEVEETYDVDVIDLQRIDPDAFASDRIRLGDIVLVDDAQLDVSAALRVVQLVRNLVVPGAVQLQLSTRAPGILGQLTNQVRKARPGKGATSADPVASGPYGSVQPSVGSDGAVTFVFAGNEIARSFGYRVATAPPPAEEIDTPVGLTIVDARSGEVNPDVAIAGDQKAYITGYFFPQPAAQGEAGRRALGVAQVPGAGAIDPEHPLKNGEYLSTHRQLMAAADDAIRMAQQYVYGFGSEGGEGGLPIDKILTQDLYDPTGTIKLIDTAFQRLREITFESSVKDSLSRRVDGMLLKMDPSSPDNAFGIAYADGTPVQNLRPGEAGANITEGRTSADVLTGAGKAVLQAGADKTALNTAANVLVGAGLAVRQYGADITGSNTSADVQTGLGKAVLQTGADKTALNVAADVAAVNGTSASVVKDGANKAHNGLESTGEVKPDKVGDGAFKTGIFGSYAILDRVFAANVWTQALFTKIVGADTVVTRNLVASQVAATDVYAENLAAIVAVLGEIAAGIMFNTTRVNNPTAAIRLSSGYTIPASVLRYIDLAGIATWFIYHPALRVSATSGDAEFSGKVQLLMGQSGSQIEFWNGATLFGNIKAFEQLGDPSWGEVLQLERGGGRLQIHNGGAQLWGSLGITGNVSISGLWPSFDQANLVVNGFSAVRGNHELRVGADQFGASKWALRKGTSAEENLDILCNGSALFYFKGDGNAYADTAWNVFSPEPPKPALEMTAADWMAWAMEDAGKPVKPYQGLPTDDHPIVLEEARRKKKARAKVAEQERERYGKDVAKIAIGTAHAADQMLRKMEEMEARIRELEERAAAA